MVQSFWCAVTGIYQERDHANMVRTVAAIIREHDEETISNRDHDEASHLMTPMMQSSQLRGVAQVSLDNISQSMNRRRTVGAYYTMLNIKRHLT